MYHDILVPVAYEPGFDTRREIAAASALAAPGVRVLLLHVMEPMPFYAISYMPEGWRDELVEAIKADLTAQASALSNTSVAVIEGDPGRAILDLAQAEGVDCIIIASHRSDPSLFGSTASWVARHAACAVHLIR